MGYWLVGAGMGPPPLLPLQLLREPTLSPGNLNPLTTPRPPPPAVTMEELTNDEEYADILEDMRDECAKFGAVVNVVIPRPGPPDAPPPPGLGKVIIEFGDGMAAATARNSLSGRKFGGRTVVATMITDDDYAAQRWD